MISRQEKNKVYVNEIKKEQAISLSKKILKVFLIIFLLFASLFSYIYFIGVKGLKTNEIRIINQSIPDSFNGIKILHFTDLLYGSNIKEEELTTLLKEIKLINPDIVFFTGNILMKNYDIKENELKIINNFFKDIPYHIGKYAVRGNLDKSSFDLIMDKTDFIILDNENIDVYHNDTTPINITGININNHDNIASSNTNFTITLINNYDEYKKKNITSNLVFAGHNLGGEIRFFGIPLLGDSKYLDSHYKEGNEDIYISSGLGSIHHMRFLNKPSINVYRLYNH